jgi:hypothetical protein
MIAFVSSSDRRILHAVELGVVVLIEIEAGEKASTFKAKAEKIVTKVSDRVIIRNNTIQKVVL